MKNINFHHKITNDQHTWSFYMYISIYWKNGGREIFYGHMTRVQIY